MRKRGVEDSRAQSKLNRKSNHIHKRKEYESGEVENGQLRICCMYTLEEKEYMEDITVIRYLSLRLLSWAWSYRPHAHDRSAISGCRDSPSEEELDDHSADTKAN
jgi:hypothetical protein